MVLTDQYIRGQILKRRIRLGKEPKFIFINKDSIGELIQIYHSDEALQKLSPLGYEFIAQTVYGLQIEYDPDVPEHEVRIV